MFGYFTIEALQGCLAKSMLALEALICFSRSRRFSAFLRAPVFFLGIFHGLWGEKNRFVMNAHKIMYGTTWIHKTNPALKLDLGVPMLTVLHLYFLF